MADAVVVGAGVNGLVAANLLAEAGWDVVVCEAADEAGGACRSAEVAAPGFVTDLFSAFYPLAAVSPVLDGLGLADHGLSWVHAPRVLAHPTPDGNCVVLSTDPEETAASLAAHAVQGAKAAKGAAGPVATGPASALAGPGSAGGTDAAAWLALFDRWRRLRDPLIDALLTAPFPPVRAGARLARTLGIADGLRFARFATLPVRRFADEEFAGAGAGLLLAGNAMHTDLGPDAAGSAVFGWLLAMLGQDVGFPVPRGGSGQIPAALVRRMRTRGAMLRTGAAVTDIVVRGGRARGVRLADGTLLPARRAVIADVDAVTLYRSLVAAEQLPARLLADLGRFQWDNATFKVNWALSGPIPWADTRCAGAGTVHLGGTMDDLTRVSAELACSQVPAHPLLILGQMTTADPTRSPAGTESAWAYLHVPQRPRGDAGGEGITGDWGPEDVGTMVARVERTIEAAAPGFGARVVGRNVQSPLGLEASDAILHRGALNGGTAALHQQLIFRPVPGLGRPETPIAGLYLGSMSAHPGGGVHGGAGAIAARCALKGAGVLAPARRRAFAAATRRLYPPA